METSCRRLLYSLATLAVPLASQPALAASSDPGSPVDRLGEMLPNWSALPFAGMLVSIALFPLFAPYFWRRHYPKVSVAWALVFAIPLLFVYRGAAWYEIVRVMIVDYIPFITLLWGLFTISGGIVLRGSLAGTPSANTVFLLAGTVLASWIGTTGAAVLLIRPLLRSIERRRQKAHIVVFFIFLVANIGGCLTPLGDPPLFLGFLHSVPFFWTMNLLPHLGFAAAALLGLFYVVDRRQYGREMAASGSADSRVPPRTGLRLVGFPNVALLAGVVGAVLLSGLWKTGSVTIAGVSVGVGDLLREGLVLLLGALSLLVTPPALRRENEFSWEPIREVAILFGAIFVTIIAPIAILRAGERGHLALLVRTVKEPLHYFWAAGGLSSFLDNAPTYLTFLNLELGRLYPGQPEAVAVHRLLAEHSSFLQAVAVGAVFMGANTYVGNAPNFMVKAIAEEAGVAMPSFLGYVFRFTLPILIPLFLLLGWIFFR